MRGFVDRLVSRDVSLVAVITIVSVIPFIREPDLLVALRLEAADLSSFLGISQKTIPFDRLNPLIKGTVDAADLAIMFIGRHGIIIIAVVVGSVV